MKLTYFIYLQLTIRRLIKHFTVIYADANKQFLTLNLIFLFFLPRKNLPIWDPNLPTKNCRSPYLSPRKYHMYVAHISSESRGTFRQKARSLAPLNGWACAVKLCHDGMLEDTNSLDGAQLWFNSPVNTMKVICFTRLESNAKLNPFSKLLAVHPY